MLDGVRNHWASMGETEATTAIADRDLIERFVHSVTVKPQALELQLIVKNQTSADTEESETKQEQRPSTPNDRRHLAALDGSILRCCEGHRTCSLRKVGTHARVP